MENISVYSQKDLNEIERNFSGCINIYGGDYCNPIIVRGAWNNSTVKARDNSTVEARDNSSVVACENSTVVARDNSNVVARENSYVEAYDNSTVEAHGSSYVVAWENSTVEAWGNSSVDLNGYAQARIYSDNVNYTTSGYARVILPFDGIDSYINYFGIKEKQDKIILYKAVRKDDHGVLTSYYDSEFKYEIGKTAHQANINTDTDEACGVGLHVSTADFALRNYANREDFVIIECEVPKDKTVVYRFSDGKIRTSELRVLREVPFEELGAYGRIVAKKRKEGGEENE